LVLLTLRLALDLSRLVQLLGLFPPIYQKVLGQAIPIVKMDMSCLILPNGIKTVITVSPVELKNKQNGEPVYIAIDPGKTTGYALFNEQGLSTFIGKITGEDKFLDELESLVAGGSIKIMIIEGYRNRPNMIHNMRSTNPTSQHIGAIKRIARKAGITVVEQAASPALAIGLKFLGVAHLYVNKHVPDEVSALAHGTYYLRQQKVL
jgi:hypothetical protein